MCTEIRLGYDSTSLTSYDEPRLVQNSAGMHQNHENYSSESPQSSGKGSAPFRQHGNENRLKWHAKHFNGHTESGCTLRQVPGIDPII